MMLPFRKLWFSNTEWLERQQNSILSAAFIITIFNVFSMASGFLRDRAYIALFYDTAIASKESLEALLVATQLPETMFNLIISGAISAAFIPVFINYKKENEAAAFEMMSAIMTALVLIFMLISIPIFVFAEPITRLTTGDKFTPDQVALAANLTRMMLLPQIFFAISSFLGASLQSYQRFIMPSLAPGLYNLGIILGIFLLSPWFGIYSAGIGITVGAFLHMIIQAPLVYKLGFRYKPSLKLNTPEAKQVFKLMPPRVLSISVSEFRNLAFRYFLTGIGNSSVLIMQIGLRIMAAPIRLLGVPISQASLPFLTEVASRDKEKFKELILQSLHQIVFFVMPAAVLILILRVPVVRLLFGTYNFPWPMTVLSGQVLGILAISIAVQACVQLLIRAFYALRDTKTPFLVAITDMIMYVALCWVATHVFEWGVLGIAAVTSFTAIIEFVLIALLLDRKVQCFRTKAFFVPQLKMISAGFFMAVFLYLPFKIFDEIIFDTSRTIELIGLTITTSTIGMLVYIYFCMLFEIRELTFFLNLFTTFGRWRKPLAASSEVLIEGNSVEGDTV